MIKIAYLTATDRAHGPRKLFPGSIHGVRNTSKCIFVEVSEKGLSEIMLVVGDKLGTFTKYGEIIDIVQSEFDKVNVLGAGFVCSDNGVIRFFGESKDYGYPEEYILKELIKENSDIDIYVEFEGFIK